MLHSQIKRNTKHLFREMHKRDFRCCVSRMINYVVGLTVSQLTNAIKHLMNFELNYKDSKNFQFKTLLSMITMAP